MAGIPRARGEVLPISWEIPAALIATGALLAVLALPVGRGLASLVGGAGFAWPEGQLVPSTLGLLRGDLGIGLTSPEMAALPPAVVTYAIVAAVEAVVLLGLGWSFAWWWRSAGPAAVLGMGDRNEVRAVLGRSALRSRRATIRPDLRPYRRLALGRLAPRPERSDLKVHP